MADLKKFGTKAWLLLLLECKKSNPNLIFSLSIVTLVCLGFGLI